MVYLSMDIRSLIKNYKTPAQAKEVIENSNVLLLSGVTGAGKDAIKHQLTMGKKYGDIVSHTTRPPRTNNGILERNGQDYHFSDITKVARMLENNEFIEAKLVHGTIYGSSIEALKEAAKKGIAVTDVDVQGVDEYKNITSAVKAVFILPPSYDQWVRRLKRRYENEDAFLRDWPKRRTAAIKEINMALKSPHYYFVVNDRLDDVVTEIKKYSEKDDYIYNDEPARMVAHNLLKSLNF